MSTSVYLLFVKNFQFESDGFYRNGYHCPITYNPADFIIGILSRTTRDKDGISTANQLCDAFEATRPDEPMKISINASAVTPDDAKYERRKPLWICTVFWLLQRNWLIVVRDPTIQNLRILQKIVS